MKENRIIIRANKIFEKLPAANIASCSLLPFFLSWFSSGSTKAAGIIGIRTPKAAKPLDFILMPNTLA